MYVVLDYLNIFHVLDRVVYLSACLPACLPAYLVVSRLALSCPVLDCVVCLVYLFPSCLVLSCLWPCLVLHCLVLSWMGLSCVLRYLVFSCLVLPCLALLVTDLVSSPESGLPICLALSCSWSCIALSGLLP